MHENKPFVYCCILIGDWWTVKCTGKKALRKHEIKKYERNKTHIEMADIVTARRWWRSLSMVDVQGVL